MVARVSMAIPLVLVACAPVPHSPTEARSKILAWYPVGTDAESVRSGLESRGWTCSPALVLDRGGAPEPALARGVFARCRISQPGFGCNARWVADLVADGGRLSDVLVTSDQICW